MSFSHTTGRQTARDAGPSATRFARHLPKVLTAAIALAAVACSDAPTSSPSQSAKLRAAASTRVAASLTNCDQVDIQSDTGIGIYQTIYVGGTQRYRAKIYSCYYGQWIPAPQITWTSSDSTIARITPGGYPGNWYADAVGLKPGVTHIKGSYNGTSDENILTVQALPVTVGITGPFTLMRYQSGQYVADAHNGTTPYSYQWRTRLGLNDVYGAWSNWYSTGSTNYTYVSGSGCAVNQIELEVQVTDAQAQTATNTMTIGISNPC